jgi:hypothetical protein
MQTLRSGQFCNLRRCLHKRLGLHDAWDTREVVPGLVFERLLKLLYRIVGMLTAEPISIQVIWHHLVGRSLSCERTYKP